MCPIQSWYLHLVFPRDLSLGRFCLQYMLMISTLQLSTVTIFYDDTTVYLSGKNLQLLMNYMNEDLACLSDWFKANELVLNEKKNKYILFAHRYTKTSVDLNINDNIISRLTNIKFLGIYLDSYMKWEMHTKYVEKKLASGLYALNSLKNMLPSRILTTIYYSMIHPFLAMAAFFGEIHIKEICIKLSWPKRKPSKLYIMQNIMQALVHCLNRAKYSNLMTYTN